MKHIKTFESFLSESQINEGAIGSKLNSIWNKYKRSGIEMSTGDDLQDLFDTLDPEEIGTDFVDVVKSLGKKPSELVSFSTANGGEDKFPKFMEDIKKSGLTYKEWFEDHGGPALVVVNG